MDSDSETASLIFLDTPATLMSQPIMFPTKNWHCLKIGAALEVPCHNSWSILLFILPSFFENHLKIIVGCLSNLEIYEQGKPPNCYILCAASQSFLEFQLVCKLMALPTNRRHNLTRSLTYI